MKNSTNLSDEAVELIMVQGLVSNTLCVGRLMAPPEVHVATHGGRAAPHVLNGWFLCGNMHADMFAAANTKDVQHDVTHFCRATGLNYLVFAQSVEDWQHRIVLPMMGDEVRGFLRDAKARPVRFSLASGHQRLALVEEGPLKWMTALPDEANVADIPNDLRPMLSDISRVAAQALLPGFLATLDRPTVENLCVTFIHPPSLLAAMEKTKQSAGHTEH